MRTVAFVFSVLILSASAVLFAQAAVSGETVRLTIDLDQRQPLSQDIYGVNNECDFRPVWFDHPAYAEKYIAAGRPFFRYPGGTGSNFYNSLTGFFDDDSPSMRDYSGHNDRIRKFTVGAGRVPDAYLQWVKEHDVSYSLFLNVCTQTFEQNIKFAAETGVILAGNEKTARSWLENCTITRSRTSRRRTWQSSSRMKAL